MATQLMLDKTVGINRWICTIYHLNGYIYIYIYILSPQLQAIAIIYSIVSAVSVFDAAAARREQRASFALGYRQVLRENAGCGHCVMAT